MNRAAIHVVVNIIDGIPVSVVRRKAKRIIVRVKPDGEIILTIPFWRATLAEGAVFLASKWEWAFSTREHVLAHPAPPVREFTPMEVAELQTIIGELHSLWAARLGEFGVAWKLRRMKTRWGVCNCLKRRITYAIMLAGQCREYIEYVVVHELTHLKVHGHGPKFKALMDARFPNWHECRRRLKES